jgi:hypothetical protein
VIHLLIIALSGLLFGCSTNPPPSAADAVKQGDCVAHAWDAAKDEGLRVCQDEGFSWDECPHADRIEYELGKEIDRCLGL